MKLLIALDVNFLILNKFNRINIYIIYIIESFDIENMIIKYVRRINKLFMSSNNILQILNPYSLNID